MFCKNCGVQIHDGAKFCQRCGTPAPVVQPVPQTAGESAVSQHAPQEDVGSSVSQSGMAMSSGRPTAPLPQSRPVQCPACGMLMFPERRHCLICDKDLGNALEPEQNRGKDEQTVTE